MQKKTKKSAKAAGSQGQERGRGSATADARKGAPADGQEQQADPVRSRDADIYFMVTRGDAMFSQRARTNAREIVEAARLLISETERATAELASGVITPEQFAHRVAAHTRRMSATAQLATESLQGLTSDTAELLRHALKEARGA